MTENKRFTAPDRYRFSHSKIQLNGEPLINDEIVRVLNVNDEAFVENFNLKKENKELKEENEQLKSVNMEYEDELGRLEEENEVCKEAYNEIKSDAIHLKEENEKLKQFIMELTTKNTGRIDLANGYSYNVKYVLKGV